MSCVFETPIGASVRLVIVSSSDSKSRFLMQSSHNASTSGTPVDDDSLIPLPSSERSVNKICCIFAEQTRRLGVRVRSLHP